MQQKTASNQKPDSSRKPRQRSSLLSWIFNRHENNNDSPSSATINEASYKTETNNSYINPSLTDYMRTSHSAPTTVHGGSNKHLSISPCRNVQETQTIPRTEIVITGSIDNDSEIQIPNRRQSHLYTPFHNQFQDINNNEGVENVISDANTKRRSFYGNQLSPIPDLSNSSTSSLSRSASWQPSSSTASSATLLSPHQLQNSTMDSIPARRTSRNYSEDPEIQAKLNAILSSEKGYFLSHVLHNNNNSETLNNNNTNVYRRSTTPASRPL
jgi:hypothetical protein